MATVTSSVEVVVGPSANADVLDARILALRERFPRAVIDRYLELLPQFSEGVLVTPGAVVVGDVRLGKVDHVHVVAYAGAVGRGIVVARSARRRRPGVRQGRLVLVRLRCSR